MKGQAKEYFSQFPAAWKLLRDYLVSVIDRQGNRTISSAALTFTAAAVVVRTGAAFDALLSDGRVGRIRTVANNTNMPALVGTVTNATHNLYAFFIDRSGALTSAMGVAGASVAAVTFPPVPDGKACIGYVRINPTGTGDFVGGTTALDSGTVVPNAVLISIVGPFDPTLIP